VKDAQRGKDHTEKIAKGEERDRSKESFIMPKKKMRI